MLEILKWQWGSMENLRNYDESDGRTDVDAPEYVAYADDDEGAIETPPIIGQDERRMHVRAYNFWTMLLEDRQFPNIEDLDPETDNDFGPNSVLLDFTNGVENPAIQFLGESLREECGIDETIVTIDEVPARSLLSRITDHYLQIIANQAPIGFEAEFVNQRGITIMYRGILLPFSTDDDTIDFIYGVINWKEVADEDVQQAIAEEVSDAMQTIVAKPEASPVWADSPTSNRFDQLALTVNDIVPPNGNDMIAEQPGQDAGLADWLSIARDSADNAARHEKRSRAALYAAIGQAYDFYLMTEIYPEDYQNILSDTGLVAQERAPMTPIVKLVFGASYDKTRLTEYASALKYAKRHDIEKGAFGEYLNLHDGGLKAIVYAERGHDNPDQAAVKPSALGDEFVAKLRSAPLRQLSEIDAGDEEFVVLVARKDPGGNLAIVGPVRSAAKLTRQILKLTDI